MRNCFNTSTQSIECHLDVEMHYHQYPTELWVLDNNCETCLKQIQLFGVHPSSGRVFTVGMLCISSNNEFASKLTFNL